MASLHKGKSQRQAFAAALTALGLETSSAGSADYVDTPTVECNERKIEFQAGAPSQSTNRNFQMQLEYEF